MLSAVLVAAGAALALLWWRARRRVAALEARLDTASHGLESLQQAFSHFAPADVVEDIIAQGVSHRAGTKDITVLFADLKGFTAIAERLDAEVLVQILNGYFERMSRAIAGHRGHVAKLIGDGMLALFGALETNPWQADDAVHAALAMRATLADYNRVLARDGLPALAFGIGVHHGPVVAGVIGSTELLEYGVIGHTVNLAARVERLTRTHGVDILVTEATGALLDRRFRLRPLPALEVKGLPAPVATFAVEGFEGDGPPGG